MLALAVFLRKPGSATRRNMFSEWFFIDNQKIHLVYSAMFYPPSDQPVPNWPPYDGNFPLPASLAQAAPQLPVRDQPAQRRGQHRHIPTAHQ